MYLLLGKIGKECGYIRDEGNEEEEIRNCVQDCPNPRATECYDYYLENGVWMEGCEEVMTDCGCYDFGTELDCYKQALNYIRKHLTFEPNNACAVLAYVQANFKCYTPEIVTPGTPVTFPGLTLPTPTEGGNNTLPDRDGPYDEDRRKPIWWYHTDHLGSSTYLTDNFGRPSHYYETLPFGEMMVEHNQSANVPSGVGYDNKYKFNGKELDDATQMYYYGARYYDPRISIFVSVDPLAEQTFEPYSYVGNNPIMFTDPTGMSKETELFNLDGKKIGEDANGNDGNVSIIKDNDKAKEIEKNYKKGGIASQSDVNSGVLTTKQELQESLNVLDRTEKNGGLKEESSIIGSSGEVYKGETGTEPTFKTLDNGAVIMTANATFYSLPSTETSGVSIHSHLTSLPVHNDQSFPISASYPSQADNTTWTKNGFNRNIIVGRLGAGNISNISKNGTQWKDKRDLGAAIYIGSNSRTPAAQLTTKAIKNILSK